MKLPVLIASLFTAGFHALLGVGACLVINEMGALIGFALPFASAWGAAIAIPAIGVGVAALFFDED